MLGKSSTTEPHSSSVLAFFQMLQYCNLNFYVLHPIKAVFIFSFKHLLICVWVRVLFTEVLELELGSSGLHCKRLYPLSQLDSPLSGFQPQDARQVDLGRAFPLPV